MRSGRAVCAACSLGPRAGQTINAKLRPMIRPLGHRNRLRPLLPIAAMAAPCPGNPNALGTERVLTVDAGDHAAGRPQGISRNAAARPQGTGAHLRRRPLAGDHAESAGRAQAGMRAGDLLPDRPQRRGHPAARPPRTGRRPLRRPPHVFAILCSTACRRPRQRRTSIAASPRTNSRSMASGAAIRPRRSSAFPVLPPTPALLDRLDRARHRGVRRRRLGQRLAADDAESGVATAFSPASTKSAAASCCCTTPRRRPRHAAGLPARAETARLPHRARGPGRPHGAIATKTVAFLPQPGGNSTVCNQLWAA